MFYKKAPSFFEKRCTVADMLNFVQQLMVRNVDSNISQGFKKTSKNIRPAALQKILASQACRYAVMFGDHLEYGKIAESHTLFHFLSLQF